MSEFGNRITAQRRILRIANSKQWEVEQLLGLSSKAIERWITANRIRTDSPVAAQIRTAAEKLFFLANKSQEQVTEEYRTTAGELEALASELQQLICGDETPQKLIG